MNLTLPGSSEPETIVSYLAMGKAAVISLVHSITKQIWFIIYTATVEVHLNIRESRTAFQHRDEHFIVV